VLKPSAQADVYTDFKGLAQLRGQARKNSPEALQETARQFESIFIQMTMKSMRGATQESGLLDSNGTRTYRDMYDQQLAVELGKQSKLGLADMLVKQMGGGKTAAPVLNGKSLSDYRSQALPALHVQRSGAAAKNALAAIDRMMSSGSATAATGHAAKGFENAQAFVEELWPHAKAAGEELGVDPKMLLAQAALESGWGKSVMRMGDGSISHNLFGIKADRSWKGPSVAMSTLEYEGGIAVRKRAPFRAYASYTDSFRDYVGFLKANPRYTKALENADNPTRFIAGLQRAGYATDPNYARKVLSIYKGHSAFEGLTSA
jgi:peptidoglycan hydrolase FlgJ